MNENPYGTPPQVPLHEVEWRIDGKPNQQGDNGPWRVRYVPYIDARWLAQGLDEWVGPQNWRRTFQHVMFRGLECVTCEVEIWFPPIDGEHDGRWVGKPDLGLIEGGGQTGTKGSYSDAFKRSACVAWGVGRNVYDLPGDIWAECKVWMRPGRNGGSAEPVARPHPNAVIQIRQELEKRGHEILHVTAEPKVGVLSADTDGTAEDADTLDEAQVAALKEQFASLTGATKETATAEFFREWGKAADIATKNYDAALEAAYRIAAAHATAPVAPASEPPGADSPPLSPGAEPDDGEGVGASPSSALTFEDIDTMSNRGLVEHLTQFDLPLTGNMAAKRARLKEAVANQAPAAGPGATMELWQAGAIFPAHPETGEALEPTETYVVGIEKYEEALTEPLTETWNEWLAGAFPDSSWPPESQYVAFTAYQTIHHLHTTGELP